MRSMIDAHPEYSIPRETLFYFLYNGYLAKNRIGHLADKNDFERFWSWYVSHRRFTYLNLDGDDLCKNILDSGDFSTSNILNSLMHAAAKKEHKASWGEKTPGHEAYLDQIFKDFPDAKVLFMIRDPRGMAASMKKVPWGNKSMIVLVKIWKRSINDFVKHSKDPRVKQVRFEHLLTNTMEEIKGVCDFLTICFNKDMLNNRKLGMQSGNDHSWTSDYEKQVNAKITQQSIYKWKKVLQPFEIRYLEKYCLEEMNYLGYETSITMKFSFYDRLRNDLTYLKQFINNKRRLLKHSMDQVNE